MKKLLVFALAAVCILGSFTACKGADVSVVEPALTASAWGNDEYTFTFQTGRVTGKDVHEDGTSHVDEGNYKLNGDGTLEVYWDNPESDFVNMLYYTFDNGELKIFTDAEQQAQLLKVEKQQ